MGPTALDPFYHYGATVTESGRTGTWDSLWVTSNRWRIARDGRTFPADGLNRGRLRFATEAGSTLADWFVDRAAGLVEVRIPWGLLNVTDPSSHRILRRISAGASFQTDSTDGFRFEVVAVDSTGAERDRLAPGATYQWLGWDVPVSHERLKAAYYAIRDLWSSW